ncbi:MAG: hypothetical protein ACSLFE_11390 [Gemmatimonadaceae bacterium]
MSDTALSRLTLAVLTATLVLGCAREDDPPMVPLGPPNGQSAPGPTITGEAKVALDSGNVLFRARAYDLALEQYRRSAALIPNDVTPLMGVLMVAQATNDSRLADSTMARIRKIDPLSADSSALEHAEMIDLHARVRTTPPPEK